jgi:hypothetical protein
VDPARLVVLRLLQAEVNVALARELLDRQEVAASDVWTVRRERVDLAGRVSTHEHSVGCSPRRVAANDNDVAVAPRPLALHTDEFRPQVEDKVVSLIAERKKDTDAELDRRVKNRGLSDCALLVRSEHDIDVTDAAGRTVV